MDANTKFITILGPTGSGKSALALALAKRFGGEIIAADSRTIYRGMDIGTAKPTAEERAAVPHHLLDIRDPGERLSAGEFKRLVELKINEIAARNRVPIVVGGSALYLDSVIFDYQFPPQADPAVRQELEQLSHEALVERLQSLDPDAAESVDVANRARVIRAIETAGQPRSRRSEPIANTLILGLKSNKEVIRNRIQQRVEKMLAEGFIDEVRRIGETYGWDSEAFNVIGYRAMKDVALGTKSVEQGAADFVAGDMALVKKQTTWWRRNPAIIWLDDASEAEELVDRFLNR